MPNDTAKTFYAIANYVAKQARTYASVSASANEVIDFAV